MQYVPFSVQQFSRSKSYAICILICTGYRVDTSQIQRRVSILSTRVFLFFIFAFMERRNRRRRRRRRQRIELFTSFTMFHYINITILVYNNKSIVFHARSVHSILYVCFVLFYSLRKFEQRSFFTEMPFTHLLPNSAQTTNNII